MRSIFTTLTIMGVLTLTLFGQSIVDTIRGIEVSGTAERMVVPDRLIFRISLAERLSGRGKITIESQEAQLRAELEKIGVDLAKDLSIYDISARYVRQRRLKDVLATQDFRLVIHDLDKVAQLQDIADKINVSSLDLVISENSRIDDIRRELRIAAIQAAKTKAEYLMGAIGGKVGSAIFVKEIEPEDRQQMYPYGLFAANTATAANVASRMPLSFAPEKVKCVILARFEIQ